MKDKIRIVHYINQFFAQRGSEDMANAGVEVSEKAVGPGLSFLEAFSGDADIVATISCGDNYIIENQKEIIPKIVEIVDQYQPHLFIAGPAYAAGRYGVACGELCLAVEKQLKIPVITAMNEVNPAVEMFKRDLFIIQTGPNAGTMRKDVKKMVMMARKMLSGEWVGFPEEAGYFPRGYKRNIPSDRLTAKRMVDMALDKFYGRPFVTETPLPHHDVVETPVPVNNLSEATILLTTDGGLYPAENPDKMPPINPDRYGMYALDSSEGFIEGKWMVNHNGYDSTTVVQDPNRLVPFDTMFEFEKEGLIKKVHPYYLGTTGLMTSIDNSRKIGSSIAEYVKNHNIDAVIHTST